MPSKNRAAQSVGAEPGRGLRSNASTGYFDLQANGDGDPDRNDSSTNLLSPTSPPPSEGFVAYPMDPLIPASSSGTSAKGANAARRGSSYTLHRRFVITHYVYWFLRQYTTSFVALLATFAVGTLLMFIITKSGSKHLDKYPWRMAKAMTEDHPWWNATQKAKKAVAKLTLEEKVAIVTGTGWQKGPCVGNIAPVPSIGFPGLCLQDGPAGLRYTDNATAFPASINVAATFDKELMLEHGRALGREFRSKGVHVALGPMMNLYRAPAAGRNWEGQGADPYLSAVSSSLQVRGIQSQGVIATAKHFIANEQEHFRMLSSSNVDERTLMEVYMLPFEACVKEGVGAVMCSYNRVNQVYACENSALVNYVLKGPDVDFRGFVMTDWWAAHSEIPTAMVTDMMMPGTRTFLSSDSYFGAALLRNVQRNLVPELRVDDMVTRILAAHYRLGQDSAEFPPVTIDSWKLAGPREVVDDDAAREALDPMRKKHAEHARKVAAASAVLLVNRDDVLPLERGRLKRIAVIGEDAGPPSKLNLFPDRAGNDGTLAMGWGSGTTEFPYIVTKAGMEVTSSLSNRERSKAAKLAAEADVALVFVNADSGEGYLTVEFNAGDRNDLKLWHYGDALIEAVAAAGKPVVVVIHAVGPVEMPWVNHPNVKAVIFAMLPGQESGYAISDILFGDVNPSGRLPFTIHERRDLYPADVRYTTWWPIPQIDYAEGLFLDYMHADHTGVAPLFPFGHGLSYCRGGFAYANIALNVTRVAVADVPQARKSRGKESSNAEAHSGAGLGVEVTVSVSNEDLERGGHEVVQLYLLFPPEAKKPPMLLKGFERVWLEPGASRVVKFVLGYHELKSWGIVEARGWAVVPGRYGVSVGASSRDIRLEASFEVV
ncbi:hypothetical protein HDU96_009707 [Phlyctochytrium bullatum]|nr:hypothetical protein HDU96_009707 [Phlyctochytrium bullatum]